ncbi:hypothetical protein LCGC14_3068600 [marine sediment metagenome]|uniref:PIN domain-containing protein n=1 Tax=marine sediment metagenome TaxID=412755 RepID=A0A0F8Z7E9_9ZZZZ
MGTFVDTSFWIALRRPEDRHHRAAQTLWESRPPQLVTTNHVVGETWTFMRRRFGHEPCVKFANAVAGSPRLIVHHPDESLEQDAWDWLRRHSEREYSFVDATSFALMRRLRMREALAFDGDFAAAGFTELRP